MTIDIEVRIWGYLEDVKAVEGDGKEMYTQQALHVYKTIGTVYKLIYYQKPLHINCISIHHPPSSTTHPQLVNHTSTTPQLPIPSISPLLFAHPTTQSVLHTARPSLTNHPAHNLPVRNPMGVGGYWLLVAVCPGPAPSIRSCNLLTLLYLPAYL